MPEEGYRPAPLLQPARLGALPAPLRGYGLILKETTGGEFRV